MAALPVVVLPVVVLPVVADSDGHPLKAVDRPVKSQATMSLRKAISRRKAPRGRS